MRRRIEELRSSAFLPWLLARWLTDLDSNQDLTQIQSLPCCRYTIRHRSARSRTPRAFDFCRPSQPAGSWKLERDARLELARPGWKPGTLPLRQSRVAEEVGVEPTRAFASTLQQRASVAGCRMAPPRRSYSIVEERPAALPGGIWGEQRGSNPYLWLHKPLCSAATPCPPFFWRSCLRPESNQQLSD